MNPTTKNEGIQPVGERTMADIARQPSIRAAFAERFGEDHASAIEAAAEGHANGINSERRGDDPFKWALLIALGYQCMELDSYREYHGVTAPWLDLKQWIKDHGALASHNGDCDYLALLTGTYNEFMSSTDAKALSELAARVEALTGPDREVDALIWCAFNGVAPSGRIVPDFHEGQAPSPTSSLDAAMTLVPTDDRDVSFERTSRGGAGFRLWQVRIALETVAQDPDETGPVALGEADTPALALTAACLRARAAQTGQAQ